MQVLGVDLRTGAVDLTKKMLTENDILDAEQWYRKSRIWHNIMRRIADRCQTNVQTVYESFGWNIYDRVNTSFWDKETETNTNDDPQNVKNAENDQGNDSMNPTEPTEDNDAKTVRKKPNDTKTHDDNEYHEDDGGEGDEGDEGDEDDEDDDGEEDDDHKDDEITVSVRHQRVHPVDIIEKSLADNNYWDKFNIPTLMKEEFTVIIHRRYQLTTKKYEMEINVGCYEANGVEVLEKVFTEIERVCPETRVTIKSSPIYTVSILNMDPEYAVNALLETTKQVKRLIEASGGECNAHTEPQCVCD